MRLKFYGGTKSVTGANYLLEEGGVKILVDCGLIQGSKYTEQQNYDDFAYDPKEIQYLFITHSHMDHGGRIPKLIKEGFKGRIFSTSPTRDLLDKALPDSLHIMRDDARAGGFEPLYDENDIVAAMSLMEGVNYYETLELEGGLKVTFRDAGHILGSSIIEIDWNGKKVAFSGDLGNPPVPLLRPTDDIKDIDYLLIESAYGNRIHEKRTERKQILEDVIKETINNGGVLMVPSFAMERTQEMLFELNSLVEQKKIPAVPVFIDSPLAIKLLGVYKQYPDYFNKEAIYLIESGDDIFNFPGLKLTPRTDESKAINDVPVPKVIMAGSGMSVGGRILHHEKRYLRDSKSTILFIGYQAKGSLGRRILEGAAEVKIHGEEVPIRCHIKAIGGYSAHADQPALVKWVKTAAQDGRLKKVFVVQGEEEAAEDLARKITEETGVEAMAPDPLQSFEL